MNQLKVFCFYDRKSQGFYPQFFCMPNVEVAKRSFSNFANSTNFPYKDIKEDLEVYQVGLFDSELGMTEVCKEFVCNLSDLIVKGDK